jgi:hypothetical protein
MKSVEQFMQEFFDERIRFNHKYYDVFLQPEKADSPERFESVKAFERTAVATTRIDVGTHFARLRYCLRAAGETWIIEKTSFQCGRCHGTGKKPSGDEQCTKCNGEGWIP